MSNKTTCVNCKYLQIDEKTSEKDWTAYQCGNYLSEYYKALVNITPNGDKLKTVSWPGCPAGRDRV